jgi:hypothetical protein
LKHPIVVMLARRKVVGGANVVTNAYLWEQIIWFCLDFTTNDHTLF